MKNIPIIGKFLSIIALFGVFAIGVAVYSTSQMKQIDTRYTAMVDHQWAVGLAVARGNRNIQSARAAIGDLLSSTTDAGNASATAELNAAKTKFVDYMDAAIKASNPDDADEIRTIKSQALAIVDDDCQHSIQAGKSATAPADVIASQQLFLRECQPKFVPLTKAMTAFTAKLEKEASATNNDLTVQTNSAVAITYGVILGGLALVVAVAFFAIRSWITSPLGALNKVMERLAGGDLTASVVGEERKDEVGSMAKTVQVFKAAGLEKIRLEKEAEAQRAEAEAMRARNEAERAAAAKQQALVVESVATGLATLSDGDLVYRLNTPFAPEYEKLRGDFNAAMDKLQETMKVISANTQGIKGGGEEISQAADDLSRRTEQQAASLEETAAALDQITATVRKTADGANEASSVVGVAKADAEHSGDVVRKAVQAMSAIENSSSQIGNIIGVIDEIAFQTNLLALNAGVEAARAGDAGRGFAVVASEVRALAQRSADAAKEIKALISASSQQVASGVELVGETGKALERIVKQVTQINGVVIEIAASAQEQAVGLNQVNTAVNQMDQVTQQNAAMVEESTAASHALAQEADELARLVAQFKVGADEQRSPRASTPRRAAPATRTAMRTTGRGGAALKPAPAAAEDSWEEF
jgi:methyl-accepting chemotaxis protein